MTHEDIVYDRRVRLINYAAEIGNVTRACRVFGVSRKTYYQWLAKAEQYGLSALFAGGSDEREGPEIVLVLPFGR